MIGAGPVLKPDAWLTAKRFADRTRKGIDAGPEPFSSAVDDHGPSFRRGTALARQLVGQFCSHPSRWRPQGKAGEPRGTPAKPPCTAIRDRWRISPPICAYSWHIRVQLAVGLFTPMPRSFLRPDRSTRWSHWRWACLGAWVDSSPPPIFIAAVRNGALKMNSQMNDSGEIVNVADPSSFIFNSFGSMRRV